MGKLKLTSKQQKGIATAAAAIAVLMATSVVYQIGSHIAWRYWMPALVDQAANEVATTQPADESAEKAENKEAGNAPDKKPAKPAELHAAIKKRSIFGPMPKKASHGMQLTGVIGKVALFNKGAIKEGDSEHGIKVVSIDGYDVTIEYKGKSEVMSLFPKKGNDKKPEPSSSPTPTVTPTPTKTPEQPDKPVTGTATTQSASEPATQPAAQPERKRITEFNAASLDLIQLAQPAN